MKTKTHHHSESLPLARRKAKPEKRSVSVSGQSGERFERAEVAAHLGSFEFNLVTGGQHWSREMYRLFKRNPALGPMPPEKFARLAQPNDRDRVLEAMKATVMHGTPFDVEFWIEFPDGESRYFASRADVTKDLDGRPVLISGIAGDITEKKNAAIALVESEARLRESTRRFERAESMAHIGSIEVDLLTGERHWSREMFRLWKRDPALGPMKPTEWLPLVVPEERERVAKGIEATLEGRAPFDQEYQLLFPDGERRWVRVIADITRDDTGHPVRITGTTQDITEERKATLGLMRSEQQFERAEAVSQVGSYEFDVVTGVKSWSRELYRLWKRDPAVGPLNTEEWLALVHPADRRRVAAATKAVFDSGASFDEVYRVEFPCGERRHYHSALQMRRNPEGRPIFISGTTRDVTEREEQQAAIIGAVEQERQRISLELHDGLGQKWTGVSLLVGQIIDDLQAGRPMDQDKSAQLTRLIKESGSSIQDIARGLLPVADYPAGLMTSLEWLVSETILPQGVKCFFRCPAPVLVGDPRVANNLFRIAQEALNNALRHGAPQLVLIQLLKVDEELCLEVVDDGRGVPKKLRGVRGLGMQTMRARAQAIRGSIVVRRLFPKGTSVCVKVVDATSSGTDQSLKVPS